MNGYIYLISDPRTHLIKLGFSKSPRRRLNQLNSEPTLLPQPLSFRLIYAFEGTLQEEKRLHNIYRQRRVRGEWFNLCQWRYMDIMVAFESRNPLPEFDYEDFTRDNGRKDPWQKLSDSTDCPCEECQ